MQGCFVPVRTQSRDDSLCRVGQVRMMAVVLPLVHVRQMYLDERNLDRCQCISQRDTGVRIGGGVDDDEVGLILACRMDAVNERTLVIALKGGTLGAGFGS